MSTYGQIVRNNREIIFNLFLYVKLEKFLSFVKKIAIFFKKIPFPGRFRIFFFKMSLCYCIDNLILCKIKKNRSCIFKTKVWAARERFSFLQKQVTEL